MNPLAVVHVGNVEQLIDDYTGRAVGDVMLLMEAALPTDRAEAIKTVVKQAMWRCAKSIKNDVERLSFRSGVN